MIYSDTCGKSELYSTLCENSLIGSDTFTAWDRNQPPTDSPRHFFPPFCVEKFFGPAPLSFDPDAHVHFWYCLRHESGEMGTKRKHEGREVEELSPALESPTDSANADNMPLGETTTSPQGSVPPRSHPTSNAQAQSQNATSSTTASPGPASTSEVAAGAPSSKNKAAKTTAATSTQANSPPTNLHPTKSPPNTASRPLTSQGPLVPPKGNIPILDTSPMTSNHLLYHALHHTSIVFSLIASYLSQDALIRDMYNANRDPMGLPFQHHTLSHCLITARGDMRSCRMALENSAKIEEYRTRGCFRTWLHAANGISQCVDMVEYHFVHGTLGKTENVDAMKKSFEEVMRLRTGGDGEDEPWQLCWEMVTDQKWS